MNCLRSVLAVSLLAPVAGWPQVERLVVGAGGASWEALSEATVGLVFTDVEGSAQPRELDPQENLLTGPKGSGGQLRNAFGMDWAFDKFGTSVRDFRLGFHPRNYSGDRTWASGWGEFVDGDLLGPRSVGLIQLDLALPLPLNRILFLTPEKGQIPGVGSGLVRDQFPRAFEISAARLPLEYLLLGPDRPGTYPILLENRPVNNRRVVEVSFPTQPLRFLRLAFPQGGFLSEVEVYGEGFPSETRYVSQVIDMGRPVNFGRALWGLSALRKEDVEAAPRPAPRDLVHLSMETRTGTDDTPMAYHVITEIGRQREVTKAEWSRAPSSPKGRPGEKGAVTEDTDHWSFWSAPQTTSGDPVHSPDGRRFLQFRWRLESDDTFTYGRLDSLAIEYAPLLAHRVVGEVALRDLPRPPGGTVEVEAGQERTFTYDLRASFDSPDQAGFDAVRLDLASPGRFVGLEVAATPVTPDSVRNRGTALIVYFPSHAVTADHNPPVRLIFTASVFDYSTDFLAQISSTRGSLPQSVDPGDANPDVSTNDTRVFAPSASVAVLSPLRAAPSVITPNGDGRNDTAHIGFTLFGITANHVEVDIHDLSGNHLRTLASEPRGRGPYTDGWDARTASGRLVPPGLYLVRVAVTTDGGTRVRTHPLAVAY